MLLRKIKEWQAKKRKERYDKEWKKGFNWAIDSILIEKHTESFVESFVSHGDGSPFDKGAINALFSLSQYVAVYKK